MVCLRAIYSARGVLKFIRIKRPSRGPKTVLNRSTADDNLQCSAVGTSRRHIKCVKNYAANNISWVVPRGTSWSRSKLLVDDAREAGQRLVFAGQHCVHRDLAGGGLAAGDEVRHAGSLLEQLLLTRLDLHGAPRDSATGNQAGMLPSNTSGLASGYLLPQPVVNDEVIADSVVAVTLHPTSIGVR